MIAVKYPVALASVFLWIGFVCAISFMEAWLKFRAPGVTIPLGLGIGRLVFTALNIMEWVFVLVVASSILWSGFNFKLMHFWILIPVALLLVQTFWLLPALDARAEMHIQGQEVPPSSLHIVYVGFEVLKVTTLFIFGYFLLKTTQA